MVREAAHDHRVELKPFRLVPFLARSGGWGCGQPALERSLSRCPHSAAREPSQCIPGLGGLQQAALVWVCMSDTDRACGEFVARSVM